MSRKLHHAIHRHIRRKHGLHHPHKGVQGHHKVHKGWHRKKKA